MVSYERFVLKNGLTVLYHQDNSTPFVAVNVLYNVGAKDEDPEKTGFAHLFEHLMFGGSINIPDYDDPLQLAGGQNNAYTTNDITNYYCSLPAENIETAFWLESDRMLSLAFTPKSLEVQRKVVCEEFKENYLNKPYGDVWHKLRPVAYQQHPYKWMTIGKELKHIEDAKLEDVKAFFNKHYTPSNAILCVAGNVSIETVKELCTKWFEPIPSGEKYVRNLPQEPEQTEARFIEVKAKVPTSAIYKAYHMSDRISPRYYTADLLTDIIGNGQSSRLHQSLVKEQKLFTNIGCYHLGSIDNGLVVISGKLTKDTDAKIADNAIELELEKICNEKIEPRELEKCLNRIESSQAFEDMGLLARANNLAWYELLGDANLMNTEINKYRENTPEILLDEAQKIFKKTNCTTLYYLSEN